MKRQTQIIGILLVAIMLSISIDTLGQRGFRRGTEYGFDPGQWYLYSDIPGLTAEQDQKINDLQTEYWKDMTDLRFQLEEKSINLNSLQAVDPVDMSKINNAIDEISAIQAKREKRRIQHYQSVKKLLTSEQKTYFDRYYGGYGYGRGRGWCRWSDVGRGRGLARCPGFGRGYGRGLGYGQGQGYGRGYGRGLGYGQGQGYGRGMGPYWDNF
jgi:Spy/CpxP family protein refolding chaperone